MDLEYFGHKWKCFFFFFRAKFFYGKRLFLVWKLSNYFCNIFNTNEYNFSWSKFIHYEHQVQIAIAPKILYLACIRNIEIAKLRGFLSFLLKTFNYLTVRLKVFCVNYLCFDIFLSFTHIFFIFFLVFTF